ncbi:MAG: NADH-quinone oxidoreductase subunit NuoE [Synergistaceae bacterium]|nr:NADH-quinone oxidoreductase subunit NuoE [Synergistaceae bacterium]
MENYDKVKELIERFGRKKMALMPILHEVQEHYGYIPQGAQDLIAAELRIPPTEIYGLITFYARFSLVPQGKNKVSACMGTACYVKGAENVLHAVKQNLGIDAGETTKDGTFSIEKVYCLGACGLAPVMTVNEDFYGKMSPDKVEEVLSSYKD